MRPFRELGARLKAALWLIVAVGVIMASLVLIAGLSKAFAMPGLRGVGSWTYSTVASLRVGDYRSR
jgi:hypothetical protein